MHREMVSMEMVLLLVFAVVVVVVHQTKHAFAPCRNIVHKQILARNRQKEYSLSQLHTILLIHTLVAILLYVCECCMFMGHFHVIKSQTNNNGRFCSSTSRSIDNNYSAAFRIFLFISIHKTDGNHSQIIFILSTASFIYFSNRV